MIIFNGISSDEVGVIVEHYPRVIFPKRKVEVYNIPGQNGDRIIDQEVYENYDQPYEIFLESKDRGGLEATIPKIASWLLSGTGYCRLEDSYFPEFYRMAYVPDAHEFLSYFNEYGRGTLKFNCMPERWYKSGETEIKIENGQILYNPSGFRARPLLRFSGQSFNEITFTYLDELKDGYISPDWTPGIEGGGSIAITDGNPGVSYSFTIPYNTGYLDTKEHTQYRYYRTNISSPYSKYYSSDFTGDYEKIYLSRQTKIEWDTGGTLYITPRWWSI